MCEVVFDVVDVGAELFGARPSASASCVLHVAHLRRVAEALHHVARARPRQDRADDLGADVRARVAADRDVVEVPRVEAGVLEAPARGQLRKAGAVLDAVEPLFLDGVDELAVDHEGRGRVAVEGVQAEDRGHERLILATVGERAADGGHLREPRRPMPISGIPNRRS